MQGPVGCDQNILLVPARLLPHLSYFYSADAVSLIWTCCKRLHACHDEGGIRCSEALDAGHSPRMAHFE